MATRDEADADVTRSPHDVAMTRRVIKYLQVPRTERDDAWRERFFRAIPTAALVVGSPQLLTGPDGFEYVVLRTPKPPQRFAPRTLAQISIECTSRGRGAVLDPEPGSAAWVFRYGDLWSLRAHGGFVGDGVEPLEAQVIPSGRRRLQRETEFLVGAPSAHLFPSWARRVVGSYLRSHMGVRDPRVALVMDFAMRPTRSLAFNVYRDDQEDAAAFDLAMQRLASWYLPPGLGILSLGRDSDGSLQTKL
ncbi:MAG: hypothetical protein R3E85_03860 [Planctomycetota bacterium]